MSKCFCTMFIKAESPYNKINMEQSTADRSKRPYAPVR